MEEGLLLVNDDFVILRKKDVFSYDGLTAVKSFSHSVSDKIKVEWVIITIIISGEAECTINGKNYRVQARDIIMSLPNYVLERRGETKDLSVNCLCISRSLFQKSISFSSYNWDVVSFLMAHPVLSLTDMEYTCLSLYYSLVSVKIGDKDKMGYKESMRCLLNVVYV